MPQLSSSTPASPRRVLTVQLAGDVMDVVERLDSEGFLLARRALEPGVRTVATFAPSAQIRVRVSVVAGAVTSRGQVFTPAEAADAPLLALVAAVISAGRGEDDSPPATVLPASVHVRRFEVPPLR
jgi:hypothetical protein